MLVQGLSTGGSSGVQIQAGLADCAAGFQGQGPLEHPCVVGQGGLHVEIIGLQIPLEFRGAGVGDEGTAQVGDHMEQLIGIDLGHGGCGLPGAAEILIHQLLQADPEMAAQVDHQAQREVLFAREDQAQIPLGQGQTALFQDLGQLALADAALVHQLREIFTDGLLVSLVHLLGQGRGGALVHSRDLLVYKSSIIIIKESTQKSISRGTLFRKKRVPRLCEKSIETVKNSRCYSFCLWYDSITTPCKGARGKKTDSAKEARS